MVAEVKGRGQPVRPGAQSRLKSVLAKFGKDHAQEKLYQRGSFKTSGSNEPWPWLARVVTFCHPVLGARRERAYKGLIEHSKLYLFFTFSLPLSHFYRSNRAADARLEPDGQAPDNR